MCGGEGGPGIPSTPWLVTTCVVVIQCRVLRNQFVWPPGDMPSPPLELWLEFNVKMFAPRTGVRINK